MLVFRVGCFKVADNTFSFDSNSSIALTSFFHGYVTADFCQCDAKPKHTHSCYIHCTRRPVTSASSRVEEDVGAGGQLFSTVLLLFHIWAR